MRRKPTDLWLVLSIVLGAVMLLVAWNYRADLELVIPGIIGG